MKHVRTQGLAENVQRRYICDHFFHLNIILIYSLLYAQGENKERLPHLSSLSAQLINQKARWALPLASVGRDGVAWRGRIFVKKL